MFNNNNSNNLPCSSYSQLDMEKMMWQTSPVIIPTAPHRLQMTPAYYSPTPYHFIFNNVGIPTRYGHKCFFNLNKPLLFCITTPTMLIATIKTNTLLKVGLDFTMQNDINSALYDMRQRLLPEHSSIDIEYITHNSLLYFKVDIDTMIWTIKDDNYITAQELTYLNNLKTAAINVSSVNILLHGFERCCHELKPMFKIQNVMIIDDGGDGDGEPNTVMTLPSVDLDDESNKENIDPRRMRV